MSTTNGHYGQLLTLEELIQATTECVVLPRQSERAGREVAVRIRVLGRTEYLLMLPSPIPGSETWPDDERAQRYAQWRQEQTPEALRAHDREWYELALKIIAAATIDPPLTVDQARLLGDDIEYLSQRILEFSGLVPERKPTESTTA